MGANVILLNVDPLVGTITDVNGDFELTAMPLGRRDLEISYVGDPARMVANYAGVMTQNDARNDIIIRGNRARHSGYGSFIPMK